MAHVFFLLITVAPLDPLVGGKVIEKYLNFQIHIFPKMTFWDVLIISIAKKLHQCHEETFSFFGIMNFTIAKDFFEVSS